MGGSGYRGICVMAVMLALMLPAGGLSTNSARDHGRACFLEGLDNDVQNDDDFATAQEIISMAPGEYLSGTTGLADTHRIDTYVLKNVPSGMVVNASVRITNWNGADDQALIMSGWNRHHMDNLAWSNREDNPDRRQWEAITFLCVVTGDYYIQLKPIAGSGTFQYQLNVRVFDPQDITGLMGNGGVFGPQIVGKVSSLKWYPGNWYKFQLTGEAGGLNDYIYANMTLPGSPDERLQGDLYIRSLEPESWSFWLNQSWWLCGNVQNEEVHAAACRPGLSWYYLDVQAYNTTGGRSENYEIRLSKTVIDSDGDNHPMNATRVIYESGKTYIAKGGDVRRGPDMFDWYKVYQKKGGGLSANLTLQEKSMAIFRLSIYRDNLTGAGYDLMSSWTNKPLDVVLNRVNALATNVSQEGWYYVAVIAQIGLMPGNTSNLADWTVCTAWASYSLVIMIPDPPCIPPMVINQPGTIVMPEDGTDCSLKLNFTGNNSGVFCEPVPDDPNGYFPKLTFSSGGAPGIRVTIADGSEDPEATVTIEPEKDWNGEADITFTATDLYGKSNSTAVHVRVTPVEDPPYVKARIPDFSVRENDENMTMKDIDLFDVFSDPDYPPFGDDNLTFGVDNSTFPVAMNGSRIAFGQAPRFPGTGNHVIVLAVRAIDRAGATAEVLVKITVLNVPRPPEFCGGMIEIFEDAVSYIDLNRHFISPDGNRLAFAYLGGASGNLTVEMASNGSAILRPAPDYFAPQEILRFRAIDPLGLNMSGELLVRIRNVNDPPHFMAGVTPDPLDDTRVEEGGQVMFGIQAADIDNKSSELRYTWSVDGVEKTALGGNRFTWRPGYEDAGVHIVSLEVSDGLADITAEWTITVLDINRPPVVVRAWPMNNTEVKWDLSIRFSAEARDPDGGTLTFTWRLSDGRIIHRDAGVNNSSFSMRLPPGRMSIVLLDVEDGGGNITRETFYVNVGAEDKGIEIPWKLIGDCALAALGVAVFVQLLRRRRHGGGRHI